MIKARLAVLAPSAAILLFAQPSFASPLVVVVAPSARQALASRLCAEITLRKIRCRTMISAWGQAPEVGLVERMGARAAITISNAGVRQVVLRRGDHRRAFAMSSLAESDEMAALRTAEVARALLVDDEQLPPGVTPVVATTTAVARRPARFALQLEAGTTWATPQLRGPLQLGLRFAWEFSERLAVEARALFPASAQTIEGSEGVGHFFVGLATAELSLTIIRHRWIVPSVGVGLGALIVHVRGDDADGYEGTTDWGASVVGQGSVRLAVPLAMGLSAVADAAVGGSFSRLVVAFADREAASGGQPLITIAGGVRCSW
jgi:hypothetical protein